MIQACRSSHPHDLVRYAHRDLVRGRANMALESRGKPKGQGYKVASLQSDGRSPGKNVEGRRKLV